MKQLQSSMKNTFPSKMGCIIMASGLSKRFGRNKLFAEYDGKTFLERILEATENAGFAGRVVVTRTAEAAEFCQKQIEAGKLHNTHVILHDLPGRNDAVKLGIEALADMDGWMFCPCDQPLLQKESVESMADVFCSEGSPESIYRLAWKDNVGMPVIFGKGYFDELTHLPEKKGGGYVIEAHKDKVRLVQAKDELELFDVDTEENYRRISL